MEDRSPVTRMLKNMRRIKTSSLLYDEFWAVQDVCIPLVVIVIPILNKVQPSPPNLPPGSQFLAVFKVRHGSDLRTDPFLLDHRIKHDKILKSRVA